MLTVQFNNDRHKTFPFIFCLCIMKSLLFLEHSDLHSTTFLSFLTLFYLIFFSSFWTPFFASVSNHSDSCYITRIYTVHCSYHYPAYLLLLVPPLVYSCTSLSSIWSPLELFFYNSSCYVFQPFFLL